MYVIQNHIVIFMSNLAKQDIVEVRYKILNSFYAKIDRIKNITDIYIYNNIDEMNRIKNDLLDNINQKYKVYFETSVKNNKFIAQDLSFNPIYRTEYNGFVYLTDEHNDPYTLNIYCNPLRVKAGGYDKVDIIVEVLDVLGNPVVNKEVGLDSNLKESENIQGLLIWDSYNTDINGVIHMLYRSAKNKCEDVITIRVINDDLKSITKTITIINE